MGLLINLRSLLHGLKSVLQVKEVEGLDILLKIFFLLIMSYVLGHLAVLYKDNMIILK